MKTKYQILKKLLEVKTDGGYYNAHKRVILKELVEFIRTENE